MAVFKNQGYTLITAETSIDLTSADNKRILYKKPSGTSGYFSANASGTSLTYQCDNADLDEVAGRCTTARFRVPDVCATFGRAAGSHRPKRGSVKVDHG